jgi:hypothetical protein
VAKITLFFPVVTDSLDVVLSRLVCKDGLSFHTLATSKDIRAGLEARSFQNIPKSANTIRQRVLTYAEKITNEMKQQLQSSLAEGHRFSLSTDEWTSVSSHRFININIHCGKGNIINLGVVRVRGAITAAVYRAFIERRLQTFGISLKEHIVACTTDGASVMRRMGSDIGCEHQMCLAHCVHLAVCDVIYAKVGEDQGSSSETDDEDELGDVSSSPVLNNHLAPIIKKVRALVCMFRRSPTKNDALQEIVKQEHGKEINLICDCRIRWNSLLSMLERYAQLHQCCVRVLAYLGMNDVALSDSEMMQLDGMITGLKPFEILVNCLSREDCNIVQAEEAVQFTIDELRKQNGIIATSLLQSLTRRSTERRSNMLCALRLVYFVCLFCIKMQYLSVVNIFSYRRYQSSSGGCCCCCCYSAIEIAAGQPFVFLASGTFHPTRVPRRCGGQSEGTNHSRPGIGRRLKWGFRVNRDGGLINITTRRCLIHTATNSYNVPANII